MAARARRWQVTASRPGRSCTAITLAALDDAFGTQTLLHPCDAVRRTRRHARVRTARLSHALRIVTDAVAHPSPPWFMPRGVAESSIDLVAHQSIASIALVRGISSRVCVMDAVGAGKTMQAGIAIADALARGLAARVLVIVPAHLRHQWAAELSRLDVTARVLDAHGRDDTTSRLPADVSPWALPGTTIASIDLVKRRDTLVGLEGLPWDLLVVDEAHGAASHTDRHDAVDGLARRARHVILLTGTPHDGDAHRFARLLSLGGTDPLLVVRGGASTTRRRVHTLAIAPTTCETAVFEALSRYRAAIDRCVASPRVATNRLVFEVLARRAMASMLALARTVERRRDALAVWEPAQPLLFAARGDTLDGLADDEAALDALLVTPGALDWRHERALLGSLLTAAIRAVPHDSMVGAITRIVARVGEPVIVFAEHRDALVPLLPVLSRMAQVEVLHGGCTPAERARTLAAFSGGRARVLLATDTAAEGLNLHQHCRFVVHLDTPWTITRMAQREGRVDRRGQHRRVHAWRLCRRGHASDALRARLERRADAIAAALAPFGDVPVLLEDGRAREVPSLVRDAARATAAAIAARHEARRYPGRRAAVGAPTRELRSRVVAIDRATLPDSMRAADAILVVGLVVSAGAHLSVTHRMAVQVAGRIFHDDATRATRWSRRLQALRPQVEAFAADAVRALADDLVRDEMRRRHAIDCRLEVIGAALRRPLAAHFVQRSLFETVDAAPAHGDDAVALAQAWPPLAPSVAADIPLLLIPVARVRHAETDTTR